MKYQIELTPIEYAAHVLGGQSALAKRLSTESKPISKQSVSKWVKRGAVPKKWAAAISSACNGVVTASELCPELDRADTAKTDQPKAT